VLLPNGIGCIEAEQSGGLWGFSTGESDADENDIPNALLAELGQYVFGPEPDGENQFHSRYKDSNWHSKTWNLLPGSPS
jgi:hypothetical protein